jgi:hypothetical protein
MYTSILMATLSIAFFYRFRRQFPVLNFLVVITVSLLISGCKPEDTTPDLPDIRLPVDINIRIFAGKDYNDPVYDRVMVSTELYISILKEDGQYLSIWDTMIMDRKLNEIPDLKVPFQKTVKSGLIKGMEYLQLSSNIYYDNDGIKNSVHKSESYPAGRSFINWSVAL